MASSQNHNALQVLGENPLELNISPLHIAFLGLIVMTILKGSFSCPLFHYSPVNLLKKIKSMYL